jgi:predicted dehydrogenase
MTFLVGAPPIAVTAQALPDGNTYRRDNVVLTLTFADGSLGTITYLANGDKILPKERAEVFCGGRVAILDDYRTLELIKDGRRQSLSSPLAQDKGHRAAWQAFLTSLRAGGPPPIPYDQIAGVHRIVFAAAEAL